MLLLRRMAGIRKVMLADGLNSATQNANVHERTPRHLLRNPAVINLCEPSSSVPASRHTPSGKTEEPSIDIR
jgi:hypothetical protein